MLDSTSSESIGEGGSLNSLSQPSMLTAGQISSIDFKGRCSSGVETEIFKSGGSPAYLTPVYERYPERAQTSHAFSLSEGRKVGRKRAGPLDEYAGKI